MHAHSRAYKTTCTKRPLARSGMGGEGKAIVQEPSNLPYRRSIGKISSALEIQNKRSISTFLY